jgi:oxygen-independent coproporphyrinogen-3 oxidase
MADKEVLTREQEIIEAIYLGLRMTQGIDLVWFRQRFGIDFIEAFKDVITELEKRNYIITDPSHTALTRRGNAFLDSIAEMFVTRDLSNAKTA